PYFFPIRNPYDILILVSARSIYNYLYYPTKKAVTVFDQSGNNSITNTTQYTGYNSNKLLTSKIETNSKAETIVTAYTYPTDYAITPPYPSMVAPNVNIVNPIIETTVSNNSQPALHTQR